MYQLHDTARRLHIADPRPEASTVRTCREFDRVLAERDGMVMAQAWQARMCLAAEMKLAGLLPADPMIRERFLPRRAAGPQTDGIAYPTRDHTYLWS